MNFKKYITENNSIDDADIEKKIDVFFKNNSNPADKKIHGLAKDYGIDADKLEEIIYRILTKFYRGEK